MIKKVFENIERLLVYAEKNLCLNKADFAYKRNRILEILGIDTLEEVALSYRTENTELSIILGDLVSSHRRRLGIYRQMRLHTREIPQEYGVYLRPPDRLSSGLKNAKE